MFGRINSNIDDETMDRFANELRQIMMNDPLRLPDKDAYAADELDLMIIKYVREKVYERSFIYADILRGFVSHFLNKHGFTVAVENFCRDTPVFRKNSRDDYKADDNDDNDNNDWIKNPVISQ